MVNVRVEVVNEKIILQRLERAPTQVFGAISAAMERVGKGVMAESEKWLKGTKSNTGQMPVPVVTGNLRRLLNWLKPGEATSAGGGTIVAGPHETVVYDSAAYATAVALGRGSSAKFGPRDYLAAGLERFNSGNRIEHILDEEIERALS